MELREINDEKSKCKIIKKKTIKLLINYISTLINNKNEVNQNLSEKDLNIILSSGDGRKKLISNLAIINTKFDPMTYSKKNKAKFIELKNIVDLSDEEGIKLEDEFEKIHFDFIPKLVKGMKFDLSFLNLHIFKHFEGEQFFDKKFFSENTDNRDLLVIYSMKLNGQNHKFKKFKQFIDNVEDNYETYFKNIRKILLIFEVKTKEDMAEEVNEILPFEIREVNEKYISLLFNVKNPKDENSPSEIFFDNKKSKNFYFILDKNNYIKHIKAFYGYDDIIDAIDETSKINFDFNQEEYDKKLKAFYKFFSFLNNIRNEVKYNFYLSYNFDLILTYDKHLNKLLIKDIIFNRYIGEFLSKEYNKLKELSVTLKPNSKELTEVVCTNIEVDFTNMVCVKCGENINEDSELFYCYECNEKYCFDCVTEHLENNSGKDKFIDPKHNLLFFKTREKNNFMNIEKYKLGKNTFVNSENLDRFKYVKCNGCGNRFSKSARYICLSCTPGKKSDNGLNDYCQNCIVHMMKGDHEGEEIQKSKDNVYERDYFFLGGESYYIRHNHNNHIYLMLPLSSDDQENPYWDY